MTYVVKKGDTLYGISNQFGVSVTELARINNVNANNLQIGQTLTIPSKEGNNPDNMFMYTVKKGDTLYKIALIYNTTVKKIMDLNNFTSTKLSIGQIIRIPETFTKEEDFYLPSFTSYTVKKGDTLYNLSKTYNVPVDTIIKDNSLTSSSLKIGQILRIRTENELQCFGTDYTPINNDITYVVKKGDSLYQIAKKYNTSVDAIKKKNNLKTNNLSIGQKLLI
jgi:LysM repeat protein